MCMCVLHTKSTYTPAYWVRYHSSFANNHRPGHTVRSSILVWKISSVCPARSFPLYGGVRRWRNIQRFLLPSSLHTLRQTLFLITSLLLVKFEIWKCEWEKWKKKWKEPWEPEQDGLVRQGTCGWSDESVTSLWQRPLFITSNILNVFIPCNSSLHSRAVCLALHEYARICGLTFDKLDLFVLHAYVRIDRLRGTCVNKKRKSSPVPISKHLNKGSLTKKQEPNISM